VGADVVEVAPMYEGGAGEGTALAAAQVVFELLTSMVKRGVKDLEKGEGRRGGGRDEL
jgi:agmatinase